MKDRFSKEIPTIAVATPKTDARLRQEFRTKGRDAREEGIMREDCPVDGLLKKWWLEGWDGVSPTDVVALKSKEIDNGKSFFESF